MQGNTNTGVANSSTETQTRPDGVNPILHLRSQPEKSKEKKKSKSNVKWEEDVIDNENMGKKKSKICCIFHPNREFGELSDSSSGESSDDSDGEGNIIPKDKGEDHDDECCNHKHNKPKGIKNNNRPNAYERQPKYDNQSKVPEDAS